MKNNFYLELKTSAPIFGSFDTETYYKDNSVPIVISVTGAKLMKVWINQNAIGTTSDPEFPVGDDKWEYCTAVNNWTPNFTVEGNNYIHAIFDDGYGNVTETVANSEVVIFDKTAPTLTSVSINSGDDITVNKTVTVRVTASDSTSGVNKTIISGNIDSSSTTEFLWTDADRTAGYKDCVVELSNNTGNKETKTIYAKIEDRAGNVSEQKSDNIMLYTGDVDPVMILKDGSSVIGAHYGKKKFDLILKVVIGDPSAINAYKVWGNYNTSEGTTDTPEPTDYTTWGSGSEVELSDLYFTNSDGNKSIYGKVQLNIGDLAGTVATHAELPSTATDGEKYQVTTDETKGNKTTVYVYKSAKSDYVFYGEVEGSYAIHDIETTTVHHSEAEPQITLSADKQIISDKEDHNVSTLTSEFISSCNISEYKIVAYSSQAAALAGTYEDPTNVDLYGNDEIESGESWTAELLESKLTLAISGEGNKFIKCYARNLCDKWGASNVLTINVDKTAPVGNIVVDAYYKEAKGIEASATDDAGVSYMTAWVDNSAATSAPPASATKVAYHANPTVSEIDWSGVEEGDMYVHILYEDSVGNNAITTSVKAVYDETAPQNVDINIPQETKTTTIVANISASDTISLLKDMKIFGDVVGAATADDAEWVEYASSANVTLTSVDGTKTVKIIVRDNALNESEIASATTKLDTTDPAPTIVLYNAADTEALGTKTNVRDLRVHIGATEDLVNIKKYKIWGDIVGSTSEPTEWSDFTPTTGKNYMSIAAQLTDSDAVKTINVKIQDSAGNDGTAQAVITLDTEAPVINLFDEDYTIISLNDTTRKTETNPPVIIPGTLASKMTFKFNSNKKLVQYKVCVYDSSKTAETAEPIGEDNGSIHMSGTNVEAGTTIECTIKGKDYKDHPYIAAQTGANKGGYVIVVGKSEAGNWTKYELLEANNLKGLF